jgi:hypothetical protein
MSYADVLVYHTPIMIMELDTGSFITANPGGYATPLSPMHNPEKISDEEGNDYARIKVPGMSHPRYQFISGEARIIRFTLEFSWSADPTAIRRTVMWLKSLKRPVGGVTPNRRPPAICMLIFGLLYRGTKVVFTDVKAEFKELFDPWALYPLRATVEMVAEEWVEESMNAGSMISLF